MRVINAPDKFFTLGNYGSRRNPKGRQVFAAHREALWHRGQKLFAAACPILRWRFDFCSGIGCQSNTNQLEGHEWRYCDAYSGSGGTFLPGLRNKMCICSLTKPIWLCLTWDFYIDLFINKICIPGFQLIASKFKNGKGQIFLTFGFINIASKSVLIVSSHANYH